MNPIKIAVLGSTGSVGIQALDVARELNAKVVLLAAGKNAERMAEQCAAFSPVVAAMESKDAAERLARLTPSGIRVLYEKEAVLEAIRSTDADVIVHAVAGLAGLDYAFAAADSGKRLAMANKEAIIACGDQIAARLKRSGGSLMPVDSEHSAIFQCLVGECEFAENQSGTGGGSGGPVSAPSMEALIPRAVGRQTPNPIRRILLTASGGPFFGYSPAMLRDVTVERALAHPTWKMGPKITVDSATLMNKGFEIMEAVRLFGVPEEQVEVLVHRQSIVHSMVEFYDHTTKAILSEPDMRCCIRYALTYPARASLSSPGLDWTKLGSLTFESPDTGTFPLLNAARRAIRRGGSAPFSLIAADEEAVAAFLDKKIGFTDISSIVEEIMEKIDIIEEVDEYNRRGIAAKVRETSRCVIRRTAG